MTHERKNARSGLRELDAAELDHVAGGGTGIGGGVFGAVARASLLEGSESIELYPIVIGGQPPPFEE